VNVLNTLMATLAAIAKIMPCCRSAITEVFRAEQGASQGVLGVQSKVTVGAYLGVPHMSACTVTVLR
jgi:hypothetical protein